MRVVEIAAEIDIVEPVALREPGREPVARVQEATARADRKAVVAHRREDEDLVERQRLGEQPVEPHVGEQPAGERRVSARRCVSIQWRTDCRMTSSATFWIDAAMVSRLWPLQIARICSRMIARPVLKSVSIRPSAPKRKCCAIASASFGSP